MKTWKIKENVYKTGKGRRNIFNKDPKKRAIKPVSVNSHYPLDLRCFHSMISQYITNKSLLKVSA